MRFLGPRAGFSTVLIIGAVILLGAILVGNSMGNGVLGQIGSKLPASAPTSLLPTEQPTPLGKSEQNWKKTQIMAVATDPGFPDPRITPEPPPPEPVRPAPRVTHSPKPKPQDTFDVDSEPTVTPSDGPTFGYTSPPLPLPITSHSPSADESPSPQDTTLTPRPSGRGTPPRYISPTLPPIPVQTLNP